MLHNWSQTKMTKWIQRKGWGLTSTVKKQPNSKKISNALAMLYCEVSEKQSWAHISWTIIQQNFVSELLPRGQCRGTCDENISHVLMNHPRTM